MRNLYTGLLIIFVAGFLKAQVASTTSITQNSVLLCTGIPVQLSASPSGTSMTYTWSVSPVKGLASHSDLHSENITLTFVTPNIYAVNLTVSDGANTTTVQRLLVVSPAAKASFNASFQAPGYPAQLILTNYSENFTKTYWRFSGNPEKDTLFNTSRTYTTSGSYSVTLYAVGQNSCNDSSSYSFRISDSSSITLPNIFTPNGDDANDVYRPITTGIKTLNARVYNRYGTLVASWDKVRGSWDGHTISGEECSEGTYAIILEALGFDGREYKLKGFITLAR